MKLFKKESKQKKETRSLPMGRKGRSAFAVYAALVLMLCCCTHYGLCRQRPVDGYQQPQRFHLRPDPRRGYDPAGLRRGTDRLVSQIPRPQPAGQRFSHPGRRRCDYVCRGDSDPDYRLIRITAVRGQAHGGLPLTVAGKEVVECPITGLYKICKTPSTPGTSTCPRSGSSSPKARSSLRAAPSGASLSNIHDAVRAIGLALLVLFFVVGVMRTCGSIRRGEKAGARPEAVHPVCHCQRRRDLWAGADDGPL